jgi:membrane protease YdiL (CAAX protease family)
MLWGAVGMLALFSVALWIEWLTWMGKTVNVPQPLALFLQPLAHFAIIGVILTALVVTGRSVGDYLAFAWPSKRQVLLAVGYGFAGFIAMGIMFATINLAQYAITGQEPATDNAMSFGGPTALNLLALWTMMVVAAPLAEELLFRGFLFRGMTASIGTVGTIVVTSVIFGLAHKYGFGWDRVFVTGCVGVLLAWLRWRSDNIVVSMVTHAVTNACAAAIVTIIMFASSS